MKLFGIPFFIRKSILLCFIFSLIGWYAVRKAVSSSTGEFGASKTGCGNGVCHAVTRTASTIVTISTDAPQIVAGKTYTFSISVKNTNGLQKAAGCDISTDNSAKLAVNGTNSGLQYYGGSNELTHYTPRLFTADSAVWTFKYTAPTKLGPAHIYAAGNAVNYNGTNDNGDLWNTVIDTLTVVSAASVADNSQDAPDINVYPNPSKGQFILSSASPIGPSTVEVLDGTGHTVFQQHEVELSNAQPLDFHSLASGVYFLKVYPRNAQPISRRIVIEK